MKLNNYYFILFFCLVTIACKGLKSDDGKVLHKNEKYIKLDNEFIREIKALTLNSKSKALIIEKDTFEKRKIKNQEYLNNLNKSINQVYLFNDESFFDSFLTNAIKKIGVDKEVKTLYFFIITFTGDYVNKLGFILIENFDGSITTYYPNGKILVTYNNDIIEFTNQYMLNMPYSFENKTRAIDGYYSIDKVYSIGKNKYEVSSVVYTEMLYFHLEILKKMYQLDNVQ